jgi:hypothetical protein
VSAAGGGDGGLPGPDTQWLPHHTSFRRREAWASHCWWRMWFSIEVLGDLTPLARPGLYYGRVDDVLQAWRK